MNTLALIAGYASGLALMRPGAAPAEMIATSLAIDAALAPLTAFIAARRGRPVIFWMVTGFLFGAWALLLALLIRPARRNDSIPPASDAA